MATNWDLYDTFFKENAKTDGWYKTHLWCHDIKNVVDSRGLALQSEATFTCMHKAAFTG